MISKNLSLIGYASGIAGPDTNCGNGPLVLQNSPYLLDLMKLGIACQWEAMISPSVSKILNVEEEVEKMCSELAVKVSALVRNKKLPIVIGGDHTSAIGTWSGVFDAFHKNGDIGLVWIDAHMDSHTPETSESGHLHGMPLACLLGYGSPSLTTIMHSSPKIKPQNLCLIGVRSFERGEAELLQRLNVRVYLMEEIVIRGFTTVLREAVDIVSKHTVNYGVTIDIDSIDPQDAPGVDVPEPNGIHINDMCDGLAAIISDPRLIATEIVEFDPAKDQHHLTEECIISMLKVIAQRK